jgi:hypothetical protein
MPTTGGVSGFTGFLPGFLVFTSNQFQLLANFGNGLANLSKQLIGSQL